MQNVQVVDGKNIKNPVAVWNRGPVEYTEVFEDEEIKIESGAFKVMSRSEAVNFLGTHPGMDGDQFREKFLDIKPLEGMEIPTGESEVQEEQAGKYISHMDGEEFKTQAELDAHLAKLSGEDEKDKVPACPYCGKEFDKAIALRSHLAVHVKEQKEE